MIAIENVAAISEVYRRRLTFAYDAEGRRVAKNVYRRRNNAWQQTTATLFLYDGWNLAAECNATGGVIRTYVWGTDLSGSWEDAGGVGGLLWLNLPTANPASACFAEYDGNGNVTGLVRASDAMEVATYEYGPFGESVRTSGAISVTNPFRFSTKYTDNETGNIHYDRRDLIPHLGRWANRDPIEEKGCLNLYCFVRNDSITRFDALGLYALDFETYYSDEIPPPFGGAFSGTKKCAFSQSEQAAIIDAQSQVLNAVVQMLNVLSEWESRANKLCDSCVQKRPILRMLPILRDELTSMKVGLSGATSLSIQRIPAGSSKWGNTDHISSIGLELPNPTLAKTFCHEVSHIAAKTFDNYRASDPTEIYDVAPWKNAEAFAGIMSGPQSFGKDLRNWFVAHYGTRGCPGRSSDQWPTNK